MLLLLKACLLMLICSVSVGTAPAEDVVTAVLPLIRYVPQLLPTGQAVTLYTFPVPGGHNITFSCFRADTSTAMISFCSHQETCGSHDVYSIVLIITVIMTIRTLALSASHWHGSCVSPLLFCLISSDVQLV